MCDLVAVAVRGLAAAATRRQRHRANPQRRRTSRIDAAELGLGEHTVVVSAEKIPIPDTLYDTAFWRDVDDEGVGGHNRR